MCASPALPARAGSGRLLVRGTVAAGLAVAVLAGAAAAAPDGRLTGRAAAVTAPAPLSGTVRVDPEQCTALPQDPSVPVVCRVDEVARHLIDHGTVVLSGSLHRGPLDLRNTTGVTVRGEDGAVLDAAGARFALSLRDVADVRVESLTLRGGTDQTVWVERTRDVSLRGVTVQDSAGSGVQVRDSAGFVLADSRVQDAASAGVMELTGVTDSTYARLVVTRNGRGSGVYNGDGLQLAGTRVTAEDVEATANGSSARYEHGIYVSAAAREVTMTGVRASGNSGVAVKLGGSGTLSASSLTDDRIALYCASTASPGWTVHGTTLSAPQPAVAEASCQLSR